LNKDILILHFYCILSIFFFSTIEVVGKLIDSEVTPYAITAWRFFIGGIILLPLALREIIRSKKYLVIRDYINIILAGVLNVSISMLLLQLSVYYGKASLSAVIVSTNPLFVTILAFFFIKEKINKFHLIGIAIGLIGLLCILYGEKSILSKSLSLKFGVLFGFAAAITFAVYTVYSKNLITKYGNMPTLSIAFIGGAISLFIYSALIGKSLAIQPNMLNLLSLLYLSVFVTGIAYIIYFYAVNKIGAANAAQYFFLKPPIAATLAWFMHNEQIRLIQLIGIVLIMFSLCRNSILKLIICKHA